MPKTKTKRVGSDKLLARTMKPAGRITQDDRRRASKVLKGLGLTAAQKRKLVKNLKDTGVISSDKIKAGAATIKAKKPDVTGLKRGGVAKVLGVFPFIGRSVRQKGTISTIAALKPIPFVGSPLKKK